MSYRYHTTYRKDGRLYADTVHHDGPNATQATRDHNAAMTFLWCHGTDGIVSDLYNHRGEIVRHGARQGQPRPDIYQPAPMPRDIAATLAHL